MKKFIFRYLIKSKLFVYLVFFFYENVIGIRGYLLFKKKEK